LAGDLGHEITPMSGRVAARRYDDPLDFALVEAAVDLDRTARRRGITVRSSVECLIAASALRHELELLHRDRDYPLLARVSRLRHRAV
jgi:predicted nucleic acid-binding protein